VCSHIGGVVLPVPVSVALVRDVFDAAKHLPAPYARGDRARRDRSGRPGRPGRALRTGGPGPQVPCSGSSPGVGSC
jgi:hypothetical protein